MFKHLFRSQSLQFKQLIIQIKNDYSRALRFDPFNPEFTIVIFIHYKPRIAVAILDLQWMKMTWSGWWMEKNYRNYINLFHKKNRSKIP